MAFCTKCGTQLTDDAHFCGKCGTPAGTAAKADPAKVVENLTGGGATQRVENLTFSSFTRLDGQPIQSTGKTAQGYVTEMFNDTESFSSPKELADLMEKYPDQGVKNLYSGMVESWFQKSGKELRALEIKEVVTTYAQDRQSGYYTAIYKLDPNRPWISKGGKACTNMEDIALALEAESMYYKEELKKPNARLYLYFTAVEGAQGAEISEVFCKHFTGYPPEQALTKICTMLKGN